jgi:arylsulfatase A-like enzyme
VLFIVFDDMNDWVGPLGGNPQARTPNLDRFAERSLVFTNAHAAAPVCNPSRTAVLTGVPPHRSGIYANQGTLRHALPEVVTLPQYFEQNGYRVLGAGKVFHDPDPVSWDSYYPSLSDHRPVDPKPAQLPADGQRFTGKLAWAPTDLPDQAMGDFKVASWVAAQLARDTDEPFFLACGIYSPHPPWYVPAEYFEAFPLDEIVLPDTYANEPGAGRGIPGQSLHERIVAQDQWESAIQA